MTAASQEFKEPAVSSQDGSNLGFLSLGSGFSGSGNGGIGFYSRSTAEEGSHGSSDDQTDAYYQSMLQRNPNNPLFLSNYAQFLAEVRHKDSNWGIFLHSSLHYFLGLFPVVVTLSVLQ